MASNNNKGKKGFAGLSGLVSEIGNTPESKASKPKAKKRTSPQPTEVGSHDSEAERRLWEGIAKYTAAKIAANPLRALIVLIFSILLIWGIGSDLSNTGGKDDKSQNYNRLTNSRNYTRPPIDNTGDDPSQTGITKPPTTRTPSVTSGTGIQYATPQIGSGLVLDTPELRWCLREDIRLETMRNYLTTNRGIDAFNRQVSNYNSRCASYQYYPNAKRRAELDVETQRSKIVSEAIRDAKRMDR